MNIVLLCSSFNGLSQRFFVELSDAGYTPQVIIAGAAEEIEKNINESHPDIVIAPFLKTAIPTAIWQTYPCFIVHPGIVGDRGPSSLDWAIVEGWQEWGVTLLEANDVMDGGDIWAARTFALPLHRKSQLYAQEVTDAAVACLWELLEKLHDGQRCGQPLDYTRAEVRGRERPPLTKKERALNWHLDPSSTLLRKIWASDSMPGASTSLLNIPLKVFNAWQADPSIARLGRKPGEIFATSGRAVCVATLDGAIWIGHLKRTDEHALTGVKLPATQALAADLPDVVNINQEALAYHAERISIEQRGNIGILHFPVMNGAFSTYHSEELRRKFEQAAQNDELDAIILSGGPDVWSNGIDLNSIHVAEDPAQEGWNAINAIDDLAEAIFNCRHKWVISALNANVGAGGAMLMLASDLVVARAGVVINPHYRTMGLSGSELWTLTLPWRVGETHAEALTTHCLPISSHYAASIGLLDDVLNVSREQFLDKVVDTVTAIISENTLSQQLIHKDNVRRQMLGANSLSDFRTAELEKMHDCLFDDALGFSNRRTAFVMKQPPCGTPEHMRAYNLRIKKKTLSYDV